MQLTLSCTFCHFKPCAVLSESAASALAAPARAPASRPPCSWHRLVVVAKSETVRCPSAWCRCECAASAPAAPAMAPGASRLPCSCRRHRHRRRHSPWLFPPTSGSCLPSAAAAAEAGRAAAAAAARRASASAAPRVGALCHSGSALSRASVPCTHALRMMLPASLLTTCQVTCVVSVHNRACSCSRCSFCGGFL